MGSIIPFKTQPTRIFFIAQLPELFLQYHAATKHLLSPPWLLSHRPPGQMAAHGEGMPKKKTNILGCPWKLETNEEVGKLGYNPI